MIIAGVISKSFGITESQVSTIISHIGRYSNSLLVTPLIVPLIFAVNVIVFGSARRINANLYLFFFNYLSHITLQRSAKYQLVRNAKF